ncbi:Protein of unknown function [Gracilibacillus ureilyticus]|uniref:DUF1541 domain-containing protein n=1 Tax=Gracilibacillus ureilyticus TaxID=531814 RepID=A0A1H9TCF8_9BACI|nr:YdhK family protein [Gracilibacillus ureilyticus]SER94303.1 Protein of unknown function [Gracilibacillus ureilyticus]
MGKKLVLSIAPLFIAVVLAACGVNEVNPEKESGSNTENNSPAKGQMNEQSYSEEEADAMEDMDHSSMNHSSSGEVPEGLASSKDPTYPVGSKAVINGNHMEGMDGAVATIDGAYQTTVYTVTYTPTTGGEKVKDHKWVIHEEIKDAGEHPYQPGEEVVLEADHMQGMTGAAATINSVENTTVYMVSYPDSKTGEEVANHKWVTEDELSPVE